MKGLFLDQRSDQDLMRAYRAGETGNLEVLMRRHHEKLMRFLVRLVTDRAAAEDVFQETFIQVHLSADTYDAERRFEPWLFTIAANKARDLLRKTNRRKALDLNSPIQGSRGGGGRGGSGDGATFADLIAGPDPMPSTEVSEGERQRSVQRAVAELPPSLREVILLAYFQRMSYNQIADVLQIPLGTVKSRLHSAVAVFGRRWKELNLGQDGEPAGG
jgi:RNA polymerase sigma-70 factor (ECF subfamily)